VIKRFLYGVLLLPNIVINLTTPRVLGFGRYQHVGQVFLLAATAALSVILIAPQSRQRLLDIGRKLGLPHLEMNVGFQPEGALLRTLWIASSAMILTIQIPVYALLSPVPLVLGAVFSFFTTTDTQSALPRNAKLLLLLIPRKSRENLVGDLEEEFSTMILPRCGLRKAQAWYWWQVSASIAPLVWAHVKRIAALVLLWKAVK